MVALRPAGDRLHLHRNHTVLSTGLDGWIRGGEQGLFVHETRMLSDYRVLIDGRELRPVGVSALGAGESHGYYIALPPDRREGLPDQGSGLLIEDTQQTLELVVRRAIERSADGWIDVLEETLALTNYSDDRTAFVLTLAIDGDFLGLPEIRQRPLHLGRIQRAWDEGRRSLRLVWRAHYAFEHQGERGEATDERALTVTVIDTDGPVKGTTDGLAFPVVLRPHQR